MGPQTVSDATALCRETLRILRPSGTAGFTATIGAPWYDSMKAIFPSFELPPFLTEVWTKPDIITKELTELGYKDVQVKPFTFQESEEIEGFVEGMTTFVTHLKDPERKAAYIKHLKERGDGRVATWNCDTLIITARK